MKDVSRKIKTNRSAVAVAVLKVQPETIRAVKEGKVPKGDPLPVAKVAAVQAAKNTSSLIPYCHPIPVDFVDCLFELGDDAITITTQVKAIYKTGVEMEALAAAAAAALTLYDMLKPIDKAMAILGINLSEKHGGKSDTRPDFSLHLKAAVLVMSDSVSNGSKKDTSGLRIMERLQELRMDVVEYKVIPDDQSLIESNLLRFADELKIDLVVTTGGTGLGKRDVTPEATMNVVEREIPGIVEAARSYGQERTPLAMLSRGRAGLRGSTIIVNLPGSLKAVEESLDAILAGLPHVFGMLRGVPH